MLPDALRISELHLLAPVRDLGHVELLHAVAHFHTTAEHLNAGHTVNFGRPWIEASACTHGLISLPYLDGPDLENLETEKGLVRLLWLIPITDAERRYAMSNGLNALEEAFETGPFNYLDPRRRSVV